nr:hypothetical protein [Streptomyces botrytidirepellens]
MGSVQLEPHQPVVDLFTEEGFAGARSRAPSITFFTVVCDSLR